LSAVALVIEGDPALSPVRLRGIERLGHAAVFTLELEGPADAPVRPAAVLRKACRLTLDTGAGLRSVAGIVTRFSIEASDHGGRRRYRLELASRLAWLAFRRPCRTFQRLTAPAIVEQIAREGGYEQVHLRLRGDYPELRYVVQYQETDLAFVARLCEEHGFYLRFEPEGSGEALILDDDNAAAPEPYPDGLLLSPRLLPRETQPVAVFRARTSGRAPGKVTLRDYDPGRPSLALEGEALAGRPSEQDLEIYEAPGGFSSPAEGATRARRRLESLRAGASRIAFTTNAIGLAPGALCRLTAPEDIAGGAGSQAAGHADAYLVVTVETRWDATSPVFHAEIEAIPHGVPFRLPRTSPRPRIHGVQSAWVTGERGQEIHPDPLGRVHLRFHWDAHGKGDHESSLPVRVLQPQLAGPMIVPRVGWEVFVMFEDGDPDRPFVLGRSYNGKEPPPLALPANKTVSSIATDSSPGAGARTVIQMDDAAGREHLLMNAPFTKETTVAGKETIKTLKNENLHVGGDQISSVRGTEAVSVALGYTGGYGARQIGVAGTQLTLVGGNFVSHVGSKRDVVAGALVERIGNPVKGAVNLLASHALSFVGARGTAGKVGVAVASAMRAAYEGYEAKGVMGAAAAMGDSALGTASSFLPGGEAILAAVRGSSRPLPWDHGRPSSGDLAPGGGAEGASGVDGAAAGPGPGHRSIAASSSFTETIGGASTIMTPGPVSWVTAGAALTMVHGSHTTRAAHVGMRLAGGLEEQLGSQRIESKGVLMRDVKGAMRSEVNAALRIDAGRAYVLTSTSTLTIKVGGDLTITGSPITFTCGAAQISATSRGVTLKAPTITFTGRTQQSGSLTHR
jgi:type VI secretion system secreted protein VgrG